MSTTRPRIVSFQATMNVSSSVVGTPAFVLFSYR